MYIIYRPKGKAAEYSPWAANFYNGCSNRCEYCYNRHCQARALLGKDTPTLKASLKDEDHALAIFESECMKNLSELREGGLFFNFVSDPCLPETWELNMKAIVFAAGHGITCTILTKRKEVVEYLRRLGWDILRLWMTRRYLKVGFTLTGRDDLEPGASTNAERIEAMKTLYSWGIYTWASIEPVIDINASMSMITCSAAYCGEYRIGLLSGKKSYTPKDVAEFKDTIDNHLHASKIVWKNSVLKYIEKETKETRED